MKKYSAEWKQQRDFWFQRHTDGVYRHHIRNDTEYSEPTNYRTIKEAEATEGDGTMVRYMNLATGSVDTYAGWDYIDEETGERRNAVERGEVVAVVKGGNGDWVEAATIERTRYGVKDRLTSEIVYRTKIGEAQTVHERAEKWCRENLGERGEIVEIPPNEAAAALGRIRSEKKAAAVRENGKKGGRPRKMAVRDPLTDSRDSATVILMYGFNRRKKLERGAQWPTTTTTDVRRTDSTGRTKINTKKYITTQRRLLPFGKSWRVSKWI